MAKYIDEDEDGYDYDFMPPRPDYNRLREIAEKERQEKERIRLEKINSKGEYVVPDEFNHEIYKDFIEKTKADNSKKTYDDYDAKKLYYYMLTLRSYYADVMYNFYKKFDPEKLKSFSAYILGEISGNKLENDEIKFNKDSAVKNKEKFQYNESELIWQRKHFFVYQTHHERTLQALFNKKTTFQVLQQRGIEAKLMNEMYNQNFFIDLGIKPTKEVKKMNKEEGKVLEDFYEFPILKEINEEKSSKIKNLKDRKEFLIKCRKTKDALIKLKLLLSEKDNTIKNFDLYKDCKYIETMRKVIDKSLKKVNKAIDEAEMAEIHDYYDGVDVFKKD